MWLTASTCFFLVEYATEWLEVVTLGGLVLGSLIVGFCVLIGLKLAQLIVSAAFWQGTAAQSLALKGDWLKAIIAVDAAIWQGVVRTSSLLPGYTLHFSVAHGIFLLIVYPIILLLLQRLIKEKNNGN